MAETFVKSDGTEAGSRTYLRGLPKSRRSAGLADRWGNREIRRPSKQISPDIPQIRRPSKQTSRDIPQIQRHRIQFPHLSARLAAETAAESLADRWGNQLEVARSSPLLPASLRTLVTARTAVGSFGKPRR